MKRTWLNGKTFVVTGASSGLGKEISRRLILNHGCKIIGIGRSRKKFDDFALQLKDYGTLLECVTFDVTDKTAWEKFKNNLEDNNVQVDGIINCAGILPPFLKALDVNPEDLEKVLQTDFLSCVYAINALYPTISKSSTPTIINVSSSSALATIVGTAPYSAAKSALKSYTEALIYETKGKIYVSLVMPGFAATDIFRSQNTAIKEDKFISMMSMPCDKMANKIYNGILKRKTRMIFGKDAHAMNFFYRLMPKTTMSLMKRILKKADVKLFENVFKD